jgi:hypothetical protein
VSRRIAVIGLPYWGERSASSLREAGFAATYYARPGRSPAAWARLLVGLLRADLVYAVGSSAVRGSPADLVSRAGKRILMHWVGTDARVAVADHAAGRTSGRLLRRATHWADAPWLIDELAPIGVRASHHPLPVATAIGEPVGLPASFRVLIYLPATPGDAYDVEGTLEVIRALPGVQFTIAGGYRPVDDLPNVSAPGFVQDLAAVYRESTALLRLVRHDGMSHSVIEALSFGRYVLWSYPFPGATLVASPGEAIAAIEALHASFATGSLAPNLEAAAEVTQRYQWDTLLNEVSQGIQQLLS